jgi:hypothetical protein
MSDETPTVVLVHGAFADASSWNGVIELLQARRVKITSPVCSTRRRVPCLPSGTPTAAP